MPKCSRKIKDGVNVLASIKTKKATEEEKPKKNPAAVTHGHLCGLKSDKIHAEKLYAKKRKKPLKLDGLSIKKVKSNHLHF